MPYYATDARYTRQVTDGDVAERVVAILREQAHAVEPEPHLPLGAEGLGLDSIALVEVLLACEKAFGVELAAEMLAISPLTVGILTRRIEALVRR